MGEQVVSSQIDVAYSPGCQIDVAAVIKRLQSCSEQDKQDGLMIGIEMGREWACDEATLGDLRIVTSGSRPAISFFELNGMMCENYDYPACWFLDMAQEDFSGSDLISFSAGFTKGFIKGAKEVWDLIGLQPRNNIAKSMAKELAELGVICRVKNLAGEWVNLASKT